MYCRQDMQHFLIKAEMAKKKKKKRKKETLKPTVSKQGIKLLGICNSKGLKISKQSKNQLSKPRCMLAYK